MGHAAAAGLGGAGLKAYVGHWDGVAQWSQGGEVHAWVRVPPTWSPGVPSFWTEPWLEGMRSNWSTVFTGGVFTPASARRPRHGWSALCTSTVHSCLPLRFCPYLNDTLLPGNSPTKASNASCLTYRTLSYRTLPYRREYGIDVEVVWHVYRPVLGRLLDAAAPQPAEEGELEEGEEGAAAGGVASVLVGAVGIVCVSSGGDAGEEEGELKTGEEGAAAGGVCVCASWSGGSMCVSNGCAPAGGGGRFGSGRGGPGSSRWGTIRRVSLPRGVLIGATWQRRLSAGGGEEVVETSLGSWVGDGTRNQM